MCLVALTAAAPYWNSYWNPWWGGGWPGYYYGSNPYFGGYWNRGYHGGGGGYHGAGAAPFHPYVHGKYIFYGEFLGACLFVSNVFLL